MTLSPLEIMATGLGGVVLGNFLAACIRHLPRRERIAWPRPQVSRFLIVEMLTAALCIGALWLYGPTVLAISRVIFGAAMIVLFATDVDQRLLPNAITLPGIVIGFLFSWVTDPGWQASLFGIVAGGGVPWVIAEAYYRIRGREGVGMGDVKMLALIGAFLGWAGALIALLLASIAGSLVGLAIIALRRGTLQHALPFGAYLSVSAVATELLIRLLLRLP